MNFNTSNISGSILKILQKELSIGNRVAEYNEGWPRTHSKLIILEKPFYLKYNTEELNYRFLDDPRYWKEEYYDELHDIILACRF